MEIKSLNYYLPGTEASSQGYEMAERANFIVGISVQ